MALSFAPLKLAAALPKFATTALPSHMGNGEPAGDEESTRTGMRKKIAPRRGSGAGTGRISGFGDGEQGGIPRARPARPGPIDTPSLECTSAHGYIPHC
ncbi:hypothetical protein PIB30_098839 [Stylosanthes scabra]|uniref:Uncharacterized protein n=1 Tax=Stylosanthes scabra TaxID=79078 RepID=A0ABU6XVX6_9FABA|nr:hypothetical protein [Stylosanthes scabra]